MNGDGKIEVDELVKALEGNLLQIPEAVVRTMFALSDTDGSKSIDKTELSRLLRLIAAAQQGSFEETLFKIADCDYDGFVDLKELKQICKLLKWDVPRTEKMNLDEFTAFSKEAMGVGKTWTDLDDFSY